MSEVWKYGRHEPYTAALGHLELLISSPDACQTMPHNGAREGDRRRPVRMLS